MSIPNTATVDNASVSFENVPAELKSRRQWIVWRYEVRDGDPTKVPYNVHTGRRASSTDLETWVYFDEAAEAYKSDGRWDGVGFVFSSGDPYAGVDLDKCRKPETGEIDARAQAVIDYFDGAYMEVSPSGTGVHIITRARIRAGEKPVKLNWVEMYGQERYFTITGVAL